MEEALGVVVRTEKTNVTVASMKTSALKCEAGSKVNIMSINRKS